MMFYIVYIRPGVIWGCLLFKDEEVITYYLIFSDTAVATRIPPKPGFITPGGGINAETLKPATPSPYR